nr:MAG TPA: hypothetical protein [Caudoviricetes sp.]
MPYLRAFSAFILPITALSYILLGVFLRDATMTICSVGVKM